MRESEVVFYRRVTLVLSCGAFLNVAGICYLTFQLMTANAQLASSHMNTVKVVYPDGTSQYLQCPEIPEIHIGPRGSLAP